MPYQRGLLFTDVQLGLANRRHWQDIEGREKTGIETFILLLPVRPFVSSG